MLQTTKTTLCTIEGNFVLRKLIDGSPMSIETEKKLESYIDAYRATLDKFFPGEEKVAVSEDLLYDILTEFYNKVTFDEVLEILPDINMSLSVVLSDVEDYLNKITIIDDEEKKSLVNAILTDIKSLNKNQIPVKEYIGIYVKHTSRHPKFIRSVARLTMSDVVAYASLCDYVIPTFDC